MTNYQKALEKARLQIELLILELDAEGKPPQTPQTPSTLDQLADTFASITGWGLFLLLCIWFTQ